MLLIVEIFLVISLLLYCLMAGADFGAGALEFFMPAKKRKKHEEMVNKALGPVWEANHIWLIILIVILFNGFPQVFAEYSIYFHVPLTLMLLGIVFRGCAFSFRNYDPVKDAAHRYYSKVFAVASLLTPVMLGMVIGGLFFGVDASAVTYWQKYIASWFNFPSLMVGIFVLSLFAYLASAYLVGEAEVPADREYYIRWAQRTSVFMVAAGILVFGLAQSTRHPLLAAFFTNPLSLGCFVAAGFCTLMFWRNIRREKLTEWGIRLVAGAQVALVLLAWLAVIFPNVLFYADGSRLSLTASAAPPLTINILAWSLLAGCALFLPIFYYLIRVFKIIK